MLSDRYRPGDLFRGLGTMVCFAPETGQSQFSSQKIKKTGLKVRFQITHRLLRALNGHRMNAWRLAGLRA